MKLVGGILIICASICASFFYEKRLKQEIANHIALIDLIGYISTQIEYFSKPINDIFSSYKTENPVILEIISKKELADLSYFDKKIQKDTRILLCELGKGYKKEQITLCEYTKNIISPLVSELKTEYSKKCKIYRSLSLFIGISAVILLI